MVEALFEDLREARLHIGEDWLVEGLRQHVDGCAEMTAEGEVCGLGGGGDGEFSVGEVFVPVGFLDAGCGGGRHRAFLGEVPC